MYKYTYIRPELPNEKLVEIFEQMKEGKGEVSPTLSFSFSRSLALSVYRAQPSTVEQSGAQWSTVELSLSLSLSMPGRLIVASCM